MTSPTGNRGNSVPARAGQRALTLVELLLVMTLLIVVISTAAPSLKNFFHGRTLDSEARRLLALTHAGQSRAVSEGVPVVLWLDVQKGCYGLEIESGFETSDPKAVEFTHDVGLQLEVVNSLAKPRSEVGAAGFGSGANRSGIKARNLPQIRFQPDGSFDETSPQAVRLTGGEGESVFVAQSRNRLNYEIRNQLTELSQTGP